MYTCVYTYVHMHICVYTCVHMYTCTYVCIYNKLWNSCLTYSTPQFKLVTHVYQLTCINTFLLSIKWKLMCKACLLLFIILQVVYTEVLDGNHAMSMLMSLSYVCSSQEVLEMCVQAGFSINMYTFEEYLWHKYIAYG